MKLILTDVDGVLLDWAAGFDKYAVGRGFELIHPENYFIEQRFNLTLDDTIGLVTDFNHSEVYGELSPYMDAVEGVRELVKRGYRFVAITSPGNEPKQVEMRKQNLLNVFGDVFDDVICLPLLSPKYDVLERWKDSGLVFLDDLLSNCDDASKLGLRVIQVVGATSDVGKHETTPIENPWAYIVNTIKD